MKKAVYIIKPDYLNPEGCTEFCELVLLGGLNIESSYLIPNFDEFSYLQRSLEIADMVELSDEEKTEKYKELSYTILAYREKYPENIGMCCIVSGEDDDNIMFDKAKKLKRDIRNKHVRNRENSLFCIHCDDEFCFIEDKFANYEKLKEVYGEEYIHLTYMNCIHFEDHEQFIKQNDLLTFEEIGLFEENRLININDLQTQDDFDDLKNKAKKIIAEEIEIDEEDDELLG